MRHKHTAQVSPGMSAPPPRATFRTCPISSNSHSTCWGTPGRKTSMSVSFGGRVGTKFCPTCAGVSCPVTLVKGLQKDPAHPAARPAAEHARDDVIQR